MLLDAAQPVTRCSPAPLASSCSDAAAAAAASSLPVLTTAAGTAGPGQQQRKQPPSTAQRGKPSTVLLRLRKRKQAEAEAAPPLVGTRVLRSQSWRAAPAGPEAERPDHLTGSEGAAQKRQRTAAAAPVTEESGRASAGSADVAATAAVTARAAAPVGGTRRGLSKRAAASSAGGTSGKGGRKKGRKTASCECRDVRNQFGANSAGRRAFCVLAACPACLCAPSPSAHRWRPRAGIKERQEVYDRQASSRVREAGARIGLGRCAGAAWRRTGSACAKGPCKAGLAPARR